MHKAAKAYFQTQVSTVSQGRLLLMLYEGAIKFLNQAKVKIEEKDYAQKGILISKALDIINELDSSLNKEKGGELSENLHKLYFYCSTRLLKANLKMDLALIDEVINILDGLRSAYEQIIDTPEAVAAMQQAPAQNTQTQRMNRPMPQNQLFEQAPKPAAQPAMGAPKQPTARQAAQYAAAGGKTMAPAAQTQAVPPQPQQTTTGMPMQTAQGMPQQVAPAAEPVQPTAQGAPQQPASQQPENEQPQAQPIPQNGFNLAGKRFAGASMYKKVATQNTP